ncbi:sugar ABC transporter permease [Devosia rhodophyticola]|uniref:Sugar ABC transporter permease n=1 Tax=Devosia rhodophyticola TaxID=3026423 RepID=A0ABY7YZR1_9HYPH|nr:sugar ABC transporter permease [Devosia rhodophyticola]WDR06821.1 sugar ABC transporter permease [Devosia rhodophyticola]
MAAGSKLWKRDTQAAWLFLLPSLVLFTMFIAIPVIAAFMISFTEWDLFNPMKFVGFGNYTELFNDDIFKKVMGNTAYFVLASVPLQMAFGLAIALVLNRNIKGQTFFRIAYFLPVVTSTVAAALVWSWLFNSNFGIINALLLSFGVTDPPKWLGSTKWAMPAVIVVSVWQNVGYAMVLFLAGLQNIRTDIYDAAALDSARGWKRLWFITLPMLSPTTFFVLIISIIGSFQVFELVFIMTKAGPANATNTLVYYIYQNGFQFYQMGYASAAAMVLFAIVLVATLIQYRMQDRWVHYG